MKQVNQFQGFDYYSAAYDLFYVYLHRESHISKHILDSYGSISAVKLQSGIESELSVHY